MKYWVFDLDGTLVDSFGHYFLILEDLLQQQLTRDEKKILIGMHPEQIFKERAPADKVQIYLDELQQRGIKNALEIQYYEQIKPIFQTLKESDRRIAVWTNRDYKSASHVLEKTDLFPHVELLVSADCVTKRKPNPEGLMKIKDFFQCETRDMVMVGDHDHDMEAGKLLGALALRASWHQQWDDGQCPVADEQFYSDRKFYDWIRSHPLMKVRASH